MKYTASHPRAFFSDFAQYYADLPIEMNVVVNHPGSAYANTKSTLRTPRMTRNRQNITPHQVWAGKWLSTGHRPEDWALPMGPTCQAMALLISIPECLALQMPSVTLGMRWG